MKRALSRYRPALACLLAVSCIILSGGLPATAAEPDPLLAELYPAEVQTVIENGYRHIAKTYILTAEDNPSNIPRESFVRDGWLYTLNDITANKSSAMDTRSHTEVVSINTSSGNLNEILAQLPPTLDYLSDDGYSGLLELDLQSVVCEEAGRDNSSYTATATREYPHLSANDTSLIPKSISDNGRTLALDSVTWEAQHSTNVDYADIPDSYRAIAKYTAKASKSVVTGYITTAEYNGEISKAVSGNSVYKAIFAGKEIVPTPVESEAKPVFKPTLPFIIGITVLALLLAGMGLFLYLRHNVRIYCDGFRTLAAKDKISAKNALINLTPLDGSCFGIEINKFAAKALNGVMLEVRHGLSCLQHRIAYEGNTYKIEADFSAETIKAIYK